MKKLLCILSATLLMLSAAGCKPREEIVSVSEDPAGVTTTVTQDETETTTEKQTDGTTATKPTRGKTTKKTDATKKQEETGDYVFLDNRTVGENEWKYVEFAKTLNGNSLCMPIPSNWTVSETKGGFGFSIGGKVIGAASYTAPIAPSKMYLGQELNMNGNYGSRAVYETISGNTSTFDWVFSLKANGVDTLYFTIDYTELAQANVDFMLDASGISRVNGNLDPAYISSGNKKKSILILGDSDVEVSEIGSALQTLLEAGGKDAYTVTTGVASDGSYASFAAGTWADRMKSGEFGVVFIGGFKSYDNSTFSSIRTACNECGTKVVLFPGYNDSDRPINEAIKQNSALRYLNWRAEIQALIANGANSADLHDASGKATALTGFVGAHMIYRTMFNVLPPTVDMTGTANAKLDGYATSCRTSQAEVLYLAQ